MNFFKKISPFLFLLILLFHIQAGFAQQQYLNEIQLFKKQDSISPPSANPILFIGSSSITNWKDIKDYFPHHTIINRGFGGSQLTDIIYYANDVIYPYNPKQVVIYAGENDLAYSDTVKAIHVLERFKTLYSLIRKKYSDIPVVYISIKPSVARKFLMPKMEEANKLIKEFLCSEKNASFVNVYSKMLLPDGSPDPIIFLDDNLHMNSKGYAIWQRAIEPYLLK
ncbi:MAG: GDSL-type esterase/lipase family protein [Chitinophagaceae bacterium]